MAFNNLDRINFDERMQFILFKQGACINSNCCYRQILFDITIIIRCANNEMMLMQQSRVRAIVRVILIMEHYKRPVFIISSICCSVSQTVEAIIHQAVIKYSISYSIVTLSYFKHRFCFLVLR